MKDTKDKSDDRIDLVALAATIWTYRITVLSILIIFIFIGIFVAIFSPKEFTATSTFIPQTSESAKGAGSLGGLASLAGVSLGSMNASTEIPPALYPKLVGSVNFKKALLEAPIQLEGSSEYITYTRYYEEFHNPGIIANIRRYTLGLPGLVYGSLRGGNTDENESPMESQFVKLTGKEIELIRKLEKQISVQPNEKEGFVELSFTMAEPLMAAQMAKHAQDLLQKEVIAYKISNAREQLQFTEERFEEKKSEFETIQTRLASFRDRNQNISSAMALNQLERMEAEYNFSFSIYTELAKQLEQAKLQVSKDTPVFSIIQAVTIPSVKSAPNRPLILIIFIIIGLIVGLGYVFIIEYFKVIKEHFSNID